MADQTTSSSPGAAKTPVKGADAAHNVKTLGFFGFFAITASMVMAVYEYPSFASSGLHLIFFVILGGVFWFIPVALVAAEMATVDGWQSGGIFAWVGNTLGKRWGFAALFYQWFQITVGFVTMCFFVLAAIAYLVGWSALYDNAGVMFVGVAIIVWVLSFTQMGGTRLTARIARIGFIGGIAVPVAILLIGLFAYFGTGGVSELKFSWDALVPDFTQVDTLVIFATFILAYMGVEASASHVNELKNPAKTYPAVMIFLMFLAMILDAIGGIAVACTLSQKTLDGNLSYGVIEAFEVIFNDHFHMGWITWILAILLALGVLAEVSAWIVGPSRALLDTANEGIIPKSLAKTNKHGVSVKMIVIQAILVTIWDAVLCGSMALSGGSSSSVSYLTAIGMTVVIYLSAYVLFFIAYFKLVYKMPDKKRDFQIPGGKVFKTIVAVCGIALTFFTLVVSFFPSSSLSAQANTVYVIALIISYIIAIALPFIIYALRKHWNKDVPEVAAATADGAAVAAAAPVAAVADASASAPAPASAAAPAKTPAPASPPADGSSPDAAPPSSS